MNNSRWNKVLFRTDKEGGHVFAIFPYEEENGGRVGTYELMGGSSSGNPCTLIDASRPAIPMEYEELKRTLEVHAGEKITVLSRMPSWRARRGLK